MRVEFVALYRGAIYGSFSHRNELGGHDLVCLVEHASLANELLDVLPGDVLIWSPQHARRVNPAFFVLID